MLSEEIEIYIPQRKPMVMIGALLEAGEAGAKTTLTVSPGNVFVREGFFREPGLLENIAQTAAAQIGYIYVSKNIPIPIGYIAAVRDFEVFSLPVVGAVLETEISVVNKVMDITLVEGKVRAGGVLCCRCEMRIFVKSDKTDNGQKGKAEKQ